MFFYYLQLNYINNKITKLFFQIYKYLNSQTFHYNLSNSLILTIPKIAKSEFSSKIAKSEFSLFLLLDFTLRFALN